MTDPADRLDSQTLRELAQAGEGAAACARCGSLNCVGWESMPADFDRAALLRVGSLRASAEDEPTLQEYHPHGTHGWSVDAPIAPAYHPYNRCELWQCTACRRAYLRYTEYGGYYHDERVRLLDAALIDDTPLPPG